MAKRFFEILDILNVEDSDNKTRNVEVCFDLVSAEYKEKKRGTYITMGAPGNVVNSIMKGDKKPILLLLDMKEYHRINNQSVFDKDPEDKQKLD